MTALGALARPKVRAVERLPQWFVLRLATVTGVSVGWWTMALSAVVTGGVSAVVVVTVVHEVLKPSPDEVAARLESPDECPGTPESRT